jgi:tRNA 2-thiouridine synthesizing protein A
VAGATAAGQSNPLSRHDDHVRVVLDLRGLRCPLVLIRARQALPRLAAGEQLVVLATDPEAPIDLAALAADHGLGFAQEREDDEWRLVLGGENAGGSPTVI